MKTNQIAEILAAERARHTGHPDGIDVAIRYALDRVSAALADAAESEATRFCRAEDIKLGRHRDTPCPANHGFDRDAFLHTAMGAP